MQILAFYLMLFMIRSCWSCVCTPWPTLEMQYCDSNFVIRGSAREKSLPNGRWNDNFYSIEVLKIFKASSNVQVGDMLTGVTEGSSCGGYLMMNEDTLILGTLNGTTFRFWACSFKKMFDYLDAKELNILKDGMKC